MPPLFLHVYILKRRWPVCFLWFFTRSYGILYKVNSRMGTSSQDSQVRENGSGNSKRG